MYLISETTKEEREAIVKESLGNIEASCDGCMSGLAEMYQDYKNGLQHGANKGSRIDDGYPGRLHRDNYCYAV